MRFYSGWQNRVKSVPNPTEPANYTGSYTAEYRVVIAGILKKGVIKRWQ